MTDNDTAVANVLVIQALVPLVAGSSRSSSAGRYDPAAEFASSP